MNGEVGSGQVRMMTRCTSLGDDQIQVQMYRSDTVRVRLLTRSGQDKSGVG